MGVWLYLAYWVWRELALGYTISSLKPTLPATARRGIVRSFTPGPAPGWPIGLLWLIECIEIS
jgi:hypothetical protein